MFIPVGVTPGKGHEDYAVFPLVHMQMAPFNKYCFFVSLKGRLLLLLQSSQQQAPKVDPRSFPLPAFSSINDFLGNFVSSSPESRRERRKSCSESLWTKHQYGGGGVLIRELDGPPPECQRLDYAFTTTVPELAVNWGGFVQRKIRRCLNF